MRRRKEIDGNGGEQQEIPGTEQEKIPQLERAADKYVEMHDTWIAMGQDVKNHRAKVLELMRLNAEKIQRDDGEMAYVRGDYKITTTDITKLKVKVVGAEPAGE